MSIGAGLVRGMGIRPTWGRLTGRTATMTATATPSSTVTTAAPRCDPATAITRSLLGYGVIAGPLYVVVSLVQALTRDGFDLRRHAWSLLSNGSLGWLQIANFVLCGAMTIAFAVGLGRTRLGQGWPARLVGGYGAGMIVAGMFRADPALGFPVGTPADARAVSWHGLVHLAAGSVGFLCVIVACGLLARRFAADGQRGWAAITGVTGVAFLAAFVGIASGAGSAATTLGFVAAIILMSGWMSAIAVFLYRLLAPSAH
jgi:hypothetical protein